MDWKSGVAVALAMILGPLFARWIQKDKEREDREFEEWEREQEASKAAKARKALPAPAPLLLGRDGDRPGGEAGGRSDPG